MSSVRKNILDAVKTALEGISGVGKVSFSLQQWETLKPQDFPACFPIDGDAVYSRSAYPHATSEDMETEMEVVVTGYVYDKNNDLVTKRTDHIAEIEKALTGNSALDALIMDITPVSLTTDKGVIDNYGIFDFTFKVEFQYNHLIP